MCLVALLAFDGRLFGWTLLQSPTLSSSKPHPPSLANRNGSSASPSLERAAASRSPWSQIDARGGYKLEAATAYLAKKLVFRPYR